MGVSDVGAYILSLIQPHLDDNDLKVSKDKILEAIYSSAHHKALAEQIPRSRHLTADDKLKELLGHTPMQVLVGATLGLCVALTLH